MSALPPKADMDQHGRCPRCAISRLRISPALRPLAMLRRMAERAGGSAAAELSRTNIMLGRGRHARGPGMIKRIRVEPISTYLERCQQLRLSVRLPPFDPESGEIK